MKAFVCGECQFAINDLEVIKHLPINYSLTRCIKEMRTNSFSPDKGTQSQESYYTSMPNQVPMSYSQEVRPSNYDAL